MRKEVLLAIAIGIILGLGAMLAWQEKRGGPANNLLPVENPPAVESAPPPSPGGENQELKLTILEPEDESVSSQKEIALRGQTLSLSTVIIIWEGGEDILVADQEGFFETEIELSAGPNEIEISAYGEGGKVAKKILTITYSTAKF